MTQRWHQLSTKSWKKGKMLSTFWLFRTISSPRPNCLSCLKWLPNYSTKSRAKDCVPSSNHRIEFTSFRLWRKWHNSLAKAIRNQLVIGCHRRVATTAKKERSDFFLESDKSKVKLWNKQSDGRHVQKSRPLRGHVEAQKSALSGASKVSQLFLFYLCSSPNISHLLI